MALPPIIANNPVLRLFKSGPSGATEAVESPARAQTPQDIVEISAAARQRLDGVRSLSADNSGEVRQVAVETGQILGRDPALTLGLDPAVQG